MNPIFKKFKDTINILQENAIESVILIHTFPKFITNTVFTTYISRKIVLLALDIEPITL